MWQTGQREPTENGAKEKDSRSEEVKMKKVNLMLLSSKEKLTFINEKLGISSIQENTDSRGDILFELLNHSTFIERSLTKILETINNASNESSNSTYPTPPPRLSVVDSDDELFDEDEILQEENNKNKQSSSSSSKTPQKKGSSSLNIGPQAEIQNNSKEGKKGITNLLDEIDLQEAERKSKKKNKKPTKEREFLTTFFRKRPTRQEELVDDLISKGIVPQAEKEKDKGKNKK
eukprot:TRINITY_DN7273_c0_g1_i1.p1 TRINITY_DN7273_c0_g1~~TRINITY_DN7273_c0_g1_i1.p1  ORF type:complete len:233 (-),score=59.75 TRINITY_DN7273_c0_g1_i1:46-744(-)